MGSGRTGTSVMNSFSTSSETETFGSYEVKCKFGYGIDGAIQLLVIEK